METPNLCVLGLHLSKVTLRKRGFSRRQDFLRTRGFRDGVTERRVYPLAQKLGKLNDNIFGKVEKTPKIA